MSFQTPAAGYDRFMGRYSGPLAPLFADFAGVEAPMRALDVGSGPGALTVELARRLGAERVAAIDPTAHFVDACRERNPGVDARVGKAEALPWESGAFDATLAQLVVAFLRDAPGAIAEMRRVTRAGGTVAASMWAAGEGLPMAHLFWTSVRALDPSAANADAAMPYRTEASLRALASAAGLSGVQSRLLTVETEYSGFDDFWLPMERAAGPTAVHWQSLDEAGKLALRAECARRLGEPSGPFRMTASAWAVRGVV